MSRTAQEIGTEPKNGINGEPRPAARADRVERRSGEELGRQSQEQSPTGDERAKPEKPNEEGAPKPFRPSKKAIVTGLLVLTVLISGSVLYWIHARNFVNTDDAYTTGHVHQVSARIAGTVLAVCVDDNQVVRAGEALVRLDPSDNEVALEKARAALQQAEAQATEAGSKIAQAGAQRAVATAQVGQEQAQTTQAAAQLEKARSDYQRVVALYAKDFKAVSKADVDAATEALRRAQSAEAAAQSGLVAAQAQVEAAEANVKDAQASAQVASANVKAGQAQVKDAELQLSYCQIYAPVDGKVSKKTVETGQRLTPGQPLMAIVPQDVWVLANLKETQLERIQIGQRVEVTIDTLKHHRFLARVDSIQEGSGATFALLPPDNATGNFTKIVQRVPVKIVFDPESIRDFRDKIVPGLSVEPKIHLADAPNPREESQWERRQEAANRAAATAPVSGKR